MNIIELKERQNISDNIKLNRIYVQFRELLKELNKKDKQYIDDELYVDYNFGSSSEAETYTVVSTDDNGDIIIVRPSGTEPKVKLYYLVTAENRDLAIEKFEGYKSTLDAFVSATI